jgi:predicted peptidase
MKSRRLFMPVSLIGCFLFLSFNKSFSQPSPFAFQKYVSTQGDTMNYRQLTPDYDTIRKYPLVIFLHGIGERGSDNDAQLKWGVMNFASDQNMKLHPAFVIAPQCPTTMIWDHFAGWKNGQVNLQPKPTRAMELLMELIKSIKHTLPIDTNRIYITGLSMGGFGTFDAIERYPDLFAAAVPVCGGGDITRAASISKIPLWIFCGAEDGVVNPLLSMDMAVALTKAGAHVGYTQYPEVGHYAWLAAYSDPIMMEWLFRQHK